MIDALFVISPRGDCILQRAFKSRQVKNVGELFLKHVRQGGVGPVIVIEETQTTFIYVQRGGLYFVFSLASVAMPLSVCCDLLESLVNVVKDMCGVLTEENLRNNFLLLNEIVDEMFDYGVPVAHDTQQLTVALCSTGSSAVSGARGAADFVLSDAWARDMFSSETLAKLTSSLGLPSGDGPPTAPRTIPSQASQMPVGKNGSAEIFVDIKDRVSAEIDARTGLVLRGSLDGSIVVKSYMDDFPTLRLGLNDELVLDNPYLSEEPAAVRPRSLVLDDCVFDDCVDSSALAEQKCLSFCPKKGEFVLMKYRAQNFSLPFTLTATCSVVDSSKVEVTATLSSQTPREINGLITVTLQLPTWSGACSVAKTSDRLAAKKSQKVAYTQSDRSVTWINKCVEMPVEGGPACGFATRFDVVKESAPRPVCAALARKDGEAIAKYLAPFRVHFDLPMYSSSRLQIRYIRCHAGAPPPQRWVRYVTQSGSFIASFAH